MADTDDMTYVISEILNYATTDPWYTLPNAATWDNLADEDDMGTFTYSDFFEGPINGMSYLPHSFTPLSSGQRHTDTHDMR